MVSKMKKRRLFIAIILFVALAGSAVTWTQTSAVISTNIQAGGSSGSGQIVTQVVPIGETFSITRGKAQKISGVELYKIELGDAQFSNLIRIHIALINPLDIGKVLNSSNSFIEMKIYYPGTGAEEITLNYDSSKALPDTGDRAYGIMTRESGDITLFPSVIGQDTLYILASITTPGGPPPGQQEELTELKFYVDIRMNGAP